ncbi:RNA polymerase sigma-70 factor [Flammeovirgaceae bacterium SG7u.111]|nr:RNA polymerase sigma-70 factor [Flammeovirgaceae bacterium SG7u.132]WPO34615.1 RNA polymerase sigma-70 factor [Flammeovirgaceae bacterium SG7u.111]
MNWGNLKDEELICCIKEGEEKAFQALFDRYFFKLCDFSYKFLKNEFQCEEAVSDVFMNIWLKRETLEKDINIKPYLFVATRNQAFSLLRKEKESSKDIAELTSSETPQINTTIDQISYQELEHEIEKIISSLPEQRQLIFRLSRFEGLPYKEIAQILSISPNTVQNQMVKAIQQIASRYSKLKSEWELAQLIITILLP